MRSFFMKDRYIDLQNSLSAEEFFEKKAELFICENALMRQLYWCKKQKNQSLDSAQTKHWEEKEKIINENLKRLNAGDFSESLKDIKNAMLEEAQIDDATAVKHLKLAWEFYYQAEKNDKLYNDPIYKKLKDNETQLDEAERIQLIKIEQELQASATSNAKGVDICQPVSIVEWNKPCAQYNPVDRPGRYFFPLEESITEPTKLGTLNINIWTVIAALKNEGSSLRTLTPYQPLKPILALKSVASATVDHWSLSHPGDKRSVVTPGGADQLFMPFPRRINIKENKEMFDTMMKLLPQSVLEEGLYKNLDKDNPSADLENRIKVSALKTIGGSVRQYKINQKKKSIEHFPTINSISDVRDAIAIQMDLIDAALCFVAEQEYIFKNKMIKSQGKEALNILQQLISKNEKTIKLSREQKKDLLSLQEMRAFKCSMVKRKEYLNQLLRNKTPLDELKIKINTQSAYVHQEINAYREKIITVTQPKRGWWNAFLRKIGWIKEHPRKTIAFAAATVFTGGLAAKLAALHFIALGTYKIAVGLVAGGATAASIKSSSKSIKKMINTSRSTRKEAKQLNIAPQKEEIMREKIENLEVNLDPKQEKMRLT